MFHDYDTVIIRSHSARIKSVDGTKAVKRLPRLGDSCTIVHIVEPGRYMVEHVADAGMTVWLSEFSVNELAALPPGWRWISSDETMSLGTESGREVCQGHVLYGCNVKA